MQPENQQEQPVAPSPVPQQAASVTSYGQQSAPQIPQAPQAPVPPQQAPAPVQPEQASTGSAAPQAIGAVAVGEQVEGGFGYDPGDEQFDEEPIDLSTPVSWQASEYIHQEKGGLWFAAFAVVILAFMAVAIFLMQSITFAVLLAVIAFVVIVLAKRPPRVMEYSLSNEGLHIGETLHKFSDFKSFGIIRDGEEFSIMLIPRRRLQPGITVYFPEEAGEDIVDALGSRLPMKDLHLDAVDKLVRKLRL